MEGETTYTVDEAAALLQETPARVREMLATGELDGIPPGATLSGEWKVLLPTALGEENSPEDQEEGPDAQAQPADPAAPPTASDAPAQAADEATDEPPRETDEDIRRGAGESGWTTTKQAAKVLGVSRRSVQGYVRRGLLEAREKGEGVNKTFLVSIDSLNALRDRRRREAGAAAKHAEASAKEEGAATEYANASEALRHAIERVEARTAEATELRVRLEITEKAESTLRAELEEERRQREAAERERDELRRRLEARAEPRESPSEATEQPGRPGRVEPQPAVESTQEPAERRSWWRRIFGG